MNTSHDNTIQLNRATLDALRNVLAEEVRQYETVIEKLVKKKEILVSGKPQTLGQLDRELVSLNQKAVQLEKQRQLIMQSLNCENMTLEKLITHMGPVDARNFSELRYRLRRAVQDVVQLNQESKDLLNLTLKWIHETVEMIASAITPEAASYDAQGAKARKTGGASPPGGIQSTVSHSA